MILVVQVNSQELVGLSKADLLLTMKKSFPNLLQDKTSINRTYKYLKFEDKINQETLFCFLSPDDVCTKTTLMSDYSNLDGKLKFLSKNYKKRAADCWTYNRQGIDYLVQIKKEEWYFTLITTRKPTSSKTK
jgi:hypothetical protein